MYYVNADLRDEDGKTPLDKARERVDEGHREVASILQSPGEWMSAGRSDQKYNAYDGTSEPRGDSEMAPVYLKFFLPLFCKTFQSTMLSSIRKSSLGKIRLFHLSTDFIGFFLLLTGGKNRRCIKILHFLCKFSQNC